MFTLVDFKSSVRLNYLDLEDNGARTIAWLQRNVARREQTLASKHPKQAAELDDFAAQLGRLGVTPETTYLYMHGHTLMDNVVMVLLETVCEKLRQMTAARITASKKEGVALKNEMSNYTNTQRSIRDVLLDNENYQDCPLFKRLYRDIERYMVRTIWRMKQQGEVPASETIFFDRPRLSATVNVRSGTTKMPKIKTGCLTSPILTFSPLSECTLTGGGFQFHGFVRQSLINLSHCNKMDNLVVLFFACFFEIFTRGSSLIPSFMMGYSLFPRTR